MFHPAKRSTVSQERINAATSFSATSVICISDDSQSGVAADEDDDTVQTVSEVVDIKKSGSCSYHAVAATASLVGDSCYGSFLEAEATAMEGKALKVCSEIKAPS